VLQDHLGLRSKVEVGLVRLYGRPWGRLAVLVVGSFTRHWFRPQLGLREEGIPILKGVAHEAAHSTEVRVPDFISEYKLNIMQQMSLNESGWL
jgi:hypothetical protein